MYVLVHVFSNTYITTYVGIYCFTFLTDSYLCTEYLPKHMYDTYVPSYPFTLWLFIYVLYMYIHTIRSSFLHTLGLQ